MTAFIKHDGEYQINGYSFTSLGLKFPDGSIQTTAGGGSGGGGGATSWSSIIDKPTFATVATSGAYADLTGKPTALSSFSNDIGFITSVSLTWNNITSKPTIPSTTSQLTNDAGYITSSALTWNGISGKPSAVSYFTNDAGYITSSALTWSNITGKPTIPSTVSQLTNDAGYITSSSLTWNNISGKPTNSQILNSEILSPFMLMGA